MLRKYISPANAMARRLLLTVLLLVLPAIANAAWQINPSTSPGTAGTISPSGTKILADTVTSFVFTVTPKSGYKISSAALAGVPVTPDAPGINPSTGVGIYTIPKFAGSKNLVAYLVPGSAAEYSVTTSIAAGSGTILPAFASPPITALPRGGSYTFNITPAFGYQINDVTVDGVSIGAVSSYTFVAITANHAISASFLPVIQVTASVSTGGQMITGTPVTLTGAATTNDTGFSSYSFLVQDSSLATVFSYAGPNTIEFFTPSLAGTYTVTYTATSNSGVTGSSNTLFSIVSKKETDVDACVGCHTPTIHPETITEYKISPHWILPAGPSCQDCHNPDLAMAHPGFYAPVDSCAGCHVGGKMSTHPVTIGANLCVDCHNAHSLEVAAYPGVPSHTNTILTGAYPASLMSSKSACLNCHAYGTTNLRIRQEWKLSSHGNANGPAWAAEDFKTLSGCVQCHTRTGFIAYSTGKVTSAWGSAADTTKELLACNGCHNPDFTVRRLKPYSSATAVTRTINSSTTVFASTRTMEYSKSNVCLPCHLGTSNTGLINQAMAFNTFTAVSRLTGHFLVAGGILNNSAGYEFDGTPGGRAKDFNNRNSWHAGIGMAGIVDTGSAGPCVTCHMGRTEARHDFSAVFKNLTGSVTGIAAQTVCDTCHPSKFGGGTQMSAASLRDFKSGYQNALLLLKTQLQVNGINPDALSGTNWGATTLQRQNNAGAYYNYTLLASGDKAGYAHNPTYVKRLILFSLDWLDDGVFNASTLTSSAVLPLPAATRSSALDYLGVAASVKARSCYGCHVSFF